MTRGIGFMAIAAAAIGLGGCATSTRITHRSELADLLTTQHITVYAQDHRVYKLTEHVFADSVIRGWGTLDQDGVVFDEKTSHRGDVLD